MPGKLDEGAWEPRFQRTPCTPCASSERIVPGEAQVLVLALATTAAAVFKRGGLLARSRSLLSCLTATSNRFGKSNKMGLKHMLAVDIHSHASVGQHAQGMDPEAEARLTKILESKPHARVGHIGMPRGRPLDALVLSFFFFWRSVGCRPTPTRIAP